MPTKVSSDSSLAGPEAARRPAPRLPRIAIAAALGLGVAATAVLTLPPSAFRAHAIVTVVDMASPLSAMLPKAVADASVSEPVMRRAAQSLIGTHVGAPAPDLVEQIFVAVGGGRPTGREARLAADLTQAVTAKPGDAPGTLEIAAQAADPERAARIATAVAEAIVADQDEVTAQTRRKRDLEFTSRLERLKAEAIAARRHLAALGGVEADPAQVRAAAAAQTANAQARVDTIRAIIASGAPPLSDRRDVPTGIETLQTTYLDLARQLAKARETLGERHTTVISLQAEVRHAAASLTAEWRRLGRLAEAELGAARQRESMLQKADTGSDVTRRDAIEDARRGVQLADDNIMRAQTVQRETPIDERAYRLLARAPVPTMSVGFSLLLRALMASLCGVLAFGLSLLVPIPYRAAPEMTLGHEPDRLEPVVSADDHASINTREPAAAAPEVPKRREETMRNAHAPEAAVAVDTELMRSMADLLPSLDAIAPEFGAVPTIMVAANEMASGTMPVALALGRAAADVGHRVLVVEVARARPQLASAADADADPVLIDLFGVLRVALPAAATDGFLYLAPNLEQGGRIASALARQNDTPLVDDIAAEFDLIVIDGGRAAESAAAGWGADAYVRVGRFASQRDDDMFATAFGAPITSILGTIVASAFAPKAPRVPVRPVAGFGASPRSSMKASPLAQASASRPVQARAVPARRKIGVR